MPSEAQTDRRKSRSGATKEALMLAAERLIAERGMENITIREIVTAAGQKNESALQYHFNSLGGLFQAIHEHRSVQIRQARTAALEATLQSTPEPTLRQLCCLMVTPLFELASADVGVSRYIRAFGHQLALADSSPLKTVARIGGGGKGGKELGQLLRKALPYLDEKDYRRRMDSAVTLCAASLYKHARERGAFRGKAGALFLNYLIDALTGLLAAPVSDETASLKKSV